MYSTVCRWPMAIRISRLNFLVRPGQTFLTIWPPTEPASREVMGKEMRICLRPAFVLFLIGGLLLFGGCRAQIPDRRGTAKEDFCAELRGRLVSEGEGMDFVARIEVHGGVGGREVTLSYLAPESLEGCVICVAVSEAGEMIGDAELCWRGIVARVEVSALSGLLLPASALLSTGEQESLVREGDGWRIGLVDGAELSLSADGTPKRFSAPKISFDVVWFESGGVQ